MRCRSRQLTLGLGLMVALTVPAGAIAAQSCTLEYYRADNMWADWGRADGNLGAETITLRPGETKVFNAEWANEKQRNAGTTYYGAHLRRAINRGSTPVHMRVGGPGMWMLLLVKPKLFFYHHDRRLALDTGYTAEFRHDLQEVSCPAAATTAVTQPTPELAPVRLSLTGARGTTTATVTVTAADAQTGAALTGQATINGVAGATGEVITFARCSDTIEFTDTRGVTRTRTVRVPCEGTVKIAGYPDTYFTF